MKIFQTIIILLVCFEKIYSYSTGSDKCYKEMPNEMAATNPTISLTITTNNGLNDYDSCGRIPITIEFSGTIRGLLMMVITNSSEAVGRFEENSRFHTISSGASTESCITHSHNMEKSGPITLYWSAPDTDEDLTIIAFAVRSRSGEPTTTTWGEAYLNISYSNTSICSTEDTNTIESSSDSTDIVSTEIVNTVGDTNTIESYTGSTENVDNTDIDNTETEITEDPTDNTKIENTETDNTETDITEDPTDNTELNTDSEVFSTAGEDATEIFPEDTTEEFTDIESDSGEVTSQKLSSSHISTSSISKTSTKKPSSTKSSTRSISRPSALSGTRTQESTSNTEIIIFGFGLLLFSLIL